MKDTLKIVLVSFLVSFNVCVWRDAIGEPFDIAVFAALGLLSGILLYGLVYNRKD